MRIVLISAFVLAAVVLTACGSDDESGSGLSVVATTGIAADLAENVLGPDADLQQVVPDSASPHDFQLSVEDRQALEEADLVVSIGSGLEPGIPLDEIDAPQWALTEHAGELLPFTEAGAHEEERAAEEEEHAAEEEEEHDGSSDPHVWMDPTRVADSVPSLAEALGAADPEHAAGYRSRADDYARELRDLDAELQRTLESIPVGDRELVTSHDSLGYFGDRYGLRIVATAFPATGPEAEASAAALRDVTDAVRESGVPAVFAQADDDPEALSLVAEDTGVAIEEDLLIESPGDAGSYVQMLRRDVQLITDALAH